tara:strand:+ start:18326 stop:18898 length:573 start_codon:yes stop_codon:yes gene_type:complete
MSDNEIKDSRINLVNSVSTIACKEYNADSNRTNLDIVLSLYLEFEELQTQIPKCIDDIIKNSIKEGNVVKTLKVKRGREMDLDQQFNILTCLLIIQTMEGKSKLNKYNENGLSLEACIDKTAIDTGTSISNVNKCIKKYGNAFKAYIHDSTPEISFIFSENKKQKSLITLKNKDEPVSDMIKEALDILFK